MVCRHTLWQCGIALAFANFALGQVTPGNVQSGTDVQRLNRLQQLQQFNLDSRELANESIPPSQRALIDYGGYISENYYSVDDSDNDNHGLRQTELVGYFSANFDDVNQIFLRARTDYDDYNAGDSFDGHGSRLIDPDFDRAFYKFDLQQYEARYNGTILNGDVQFEGGRDLVYWGNGLSIAQTLDGVMPTFSYGPVSLQAIAGVTPTRTVDFDTSRPAYDDDTRRGFYGALLSVTLGSQHPYAYWITQEDYNSKNFLQTGDIPTRYNYNSNYLGIGSSGTLSDHLRYGAELVYETGDTLSESAVVNGFVLSPVQQTRNNIRAYGGDAKLEYLPQDTHNSRFAIEAIFASGDHNRGLTNTTFNGSAPNTTDRAFNGFGVVNTGLAFGALPSNLLVLRLGASTFPLPEIPILSRFQAGTDLFIFGKQTASAPIDEPTNDARYLGWEPDVYVNWQAASDLTFALRYGAFVPNSAAFQNVSVRQFLYGGVTLAF